MSELEKAIEDFCCGIPNFATLSDKGEVSSIYDKKRFGEVIYELIKGKHQAYSFRQNFFDSFKRNRCLNLSDEECEKYADAYTSMEDNCCEIIRAMLIDKYLDIK